MDEISILNAEFASLKYMGDNNVMQCVNMRIRCTVNLRKKLMIDKMAYSHIGIFQLT